MFEHNLIFLYSCPPLVELLQVVQCPCQLYLNKHQLQQQKNETTLEISRIKFTSFKCRV